MIAHKLLILSQLVLQRTSLPNALHFQLFEQIHRELMPIAQLHHLLAVGTDASWILLRIRIYARRAKRSTLAYFALLRVEKQLQAYYAFE